MQSIWCLLLHSMCWCCVLVGLCPRIMWVHFCWNYLIMIMYRRRMRNSMQFCRNTGTSDAHGSGGLGASSRSCLSFFVWWTTRSLEIPFRLFTMFYSYFDYDPCGSSRYNTYSFSLFVYLIFGFSMHIQSCFIVLFNAHSFLINHSCGLLWVRIGVGGCLSWGVWVWGIGWKDWGQSLIL